MKERSFPAARHAALVALVALALAPALPYACAEGESLVEGSGGSGDDGAETSNASSSAATSAASTGGSGAQGGGGAGGAAAGGQGPGGDGGNGGAGGIGAGGVGGGRPDPCALTSSVGDPACVIFEVIQSNIATAGFEKPWRGQDISFGTQALVTGVEFQTNTTPTIAEIRLMTGVANLSTLASSTQVTAVPDGALYWERVSFAVPVTLPANVEHTIWLHLLVNTTGTPGADLTLVGPALRAHHTSLDPSGQMAGAYPEWNYEYGADCRVYGVVF